METKLRCGHKADVRAIRGLGGRPVAIAMCMSCDRRLCKKDGHIVLDPHASHCRCGKEVRLGVTRPPLPMTGNPAATRCGDYGTAKVREPGTTYLTCVICDQAESVLPA